MENHGAIVCTKMHCMPKLMSLARSLPNLTDKCRSRIAVLYRKSHVHWYGGQVRRVILYCAVWVLVSIPDRRTLQESSWVLWALENKTS